MTRCCKCKRETRTHLIGESKHEMCLNCRKLWSEFLTPDIHKRITHYRTKGTPEFHKYWEKLFQKFLGDKVNVEFS